MPFYRLVRISLSSVRITHQGRSSRNRQAHSIERRVLYRPIEYQTQPSCLMCLRSPKSLWVVAIKQEPVEHQHNNLTFHF